MLMSIGESNALQPLRTATGWGLLEEVDSVSHLRKVVTGGEKNLVQMPVGILSEMSLRTKPQGGAWVCL
jgi:hypothetical protein